MWLIMVVAESMFLIFGSLIGAMLFCALLWRLLLTVRHPEMGALLIAAMALLVFGLSFTHSPFLRLMLMFALAGAAPIWIAGRQWRANRARPRTGR